MIMPAIDMQELYKGVGVRYRANDVQYIQRSPIPDIINGTIFLKDREWKNQSHCKNNEIYARLITIIWTKGEVLCLERGKV